MELLWGRFFRFAPKTLILGEGDIFSWPADEVGVYGWVLVLAAVYLVVAFFVSNFDHPYDRREARNLGERVFDAATFATSTMLLMGIFDPQIIVHLGGAKLFLVIAGLAGFLYALYALRAR